MHTIDTLLDGRQKSIFCMEMSEGNLLIVTLVEKHVRKIPIQECFIPLGLSYLSQSKAKKKGL